MTRQQRRHHQRKDARRDKPQQASAVAVLSYDGCSIDEATAPGRLSMLVPIPAGTAPEDVRPDSVMQAILDHGGALLLAFERATDAAAFQAQFEGRRGVDLSADHCAGSC